MAASHTHRRAIGLDPLTFFKGPVARGYRPDDDPRVVDYIDDADPTWRYTPADNWMQADPNGYYYHSTISYTDVQAIAEVRYYGGGFIVMGHTTPSLSDAEIWVDGRLNSTVSYYSPNPEYAHPLATVQLAEGFHLIQFRRLVVNGRTRMVNDGIVLLSK